MKTMTIAKMLFKACPRCRGDLTLDKYERRETGALTYECLQCGHTMRIEAEATRRQLATAA
jgi:Zn ribbon nucleic-acid-binding protein